MNFAEFLAKFGNYYWEVSQIKTLDTSGIKLKPEYERSYNDDEPYRIEYPFDEENARDRCEQDLPYVDDDEEFDESDAKYNCTRDSNYEFDDSEYMEDVYNHYSDDPNFEGQSVRDWEENNPEPDPDDFDDENAKWSVLNGDEEIRSFSSEGEARRFLQPGLFTHPDLEGMDPSNLRIAKTTSYDEALKQWQEERDAVEEEFDAAVQKWEEEMSDRREEAEQAAAEGRKEWISDCVDRKRMEWEQDREGRRQERQELIDSSGGEEEYYKQCIEEKRQDYERRKAEAEEQWQQWNQRQQNPPPRKVKQYNYNFKIGGEPYEVHLQRAATLTIGKDRIDNIWYVSFEGPSGYSSTGNNSNPTAAYAPLLASIKKLMETETVNGLKFTPAEPAMGLVYERFYKQFLLPTFLRIDYQHYIRKELVTKGLKGGSPSSRSSFAQKMASDNEELLSQKKRVIQDKAAAREQRRKAMAMVGKMVSYEGYYGGQKIGYVMSYKNDQGNTPRVMVLTVTGGTTEYSPDKVQEVGLGDPGVIPFLNAVMQYSSVANDPKLRSLAQQAGATIPSVATAQAPPPPPASGPPSGWGHV